MKKAFSCGTLIIMALLFSLAIIGCSSPSGSGSDSDTTPPTLLSAIVLGSAPDELILTFDEAVTAANADGWSWTGPVFSALPEGIGTATWIVKLTTNVTSVDGITISYDAAAGNTADLAGNALASISSMAVTNTANPDDTTPPTLVSAVVWATAPNKLVLTFSEPVTCADLDGWWCNYGFKSPPEIAGKGTAVWTITMNGSAAKIGPARFDYNPVGGANLTDLAGNPPAGRIPETDEWVAAFKDPSDTTPPTVLVAGVGFAAIGFTNTQLVIVFSEEVVIPNGKDGWTLTGATISAVDTIDKDMLALTLAAAPSTGAALKLSYNAAAGGIVDGNDNALASISNMTIINALGDNARPTCTNVTITGKVITFSFNEPVYAMGSDGWSGNMTTLFTDEIKQNFTVNPPAMTITLPAPVPSGSYTITYTSGPTGAAKDLAGNQLNDFTKTVVVP